jgi:hypothetical protein
MEGPVREGEGELMTRLLLSNTAPTHTTGTSGLGERLGGRASERRREEENRPYGGEGRGVWKLKEKRGTGGTSDDKRRRAD